MEEPRGLLSKAGIYHVTGLSPGLSAIEGGLKGGVQILQLRDYSLKDGELLGAARALRELTRRYQALFIVNNRPDIAVLSEADGVHVGQEDLPVKEARRILGPGKIVGVSTHALGQAQKAIAEGADYLGVGPVYATPTKAGRTPVGLDYVKQVAGLNPPIPWFAIGGIDASNLPAVLEAGARRVAVVRAIGESKDPEAAARQLGQGLEKAPLSKA
ncbi:MAG TPA: thiamine phosphate synthase [bacterium]|nr:thiamine phosphate synthase [bacterium]